MRGTVKLIKKNTREKYTQQDEREKRMQNKGNYSRHIN